MKKTGVTKKKRNRKRKREKEPCQSAEPKPWDELWELYGSEVPFWKFAAARDARSILCDAKLNWDNPLDVAEYLAEELRANLPQGLWSLKREIELRWNVKGFVPKMLKALGEYLEDQQTVFDPVDYKIAEIVEQHPEYTIKEITAELSKEFPERKWGALTRRVQQLVKDAGIPIGAQFRKLLSLIRL